MNPRINRHLSCGAVLMALMVGLAACGGASPDIERGTSVLTATWTPAMASATLPPESEPTDEAVAPTEAAENPEPEAEPTAPPDASATTEITEGDTVTDTGEITETAEITATAVPAPLGEEVIFPIEADTQVREFEPTLNFGGETTLRADGGDDPSFDSYLRVTVTVLTGSVARARLRIFAETGSDAGLSVYGTSNEWSETDLNWDNRPPRALNPLDVMEEPVLGLRWVEFDVTPAITGNGSYSFVISLEATDGLAMTSREGDSATAPQLVIEVAPSQ